MGIKMHKDIVETAIHAATLAGDHARNHIQNAISTLKQGDEIVTQVDPECQQMAIDIIKKKFPDHGFIGEEANDGNILKIEPKGCDIWWIIDPIDGTRNYAHGTPQFVCSIGIFKDGYPVAGVIYDPNTKTVFHGLIDGNAFCNNQVINCSNTPLDNNSQIALSGNFFCTIPNLPPYIAANHVHMNLGSAALHFAYVAMGAYAAGMGCNLKLWDIAGASAIVIASGGKTRLLDGDEFFPFNCHNYQGEPIPVMLGHKQTQKQLHEIITKL